MTVSVRADCPDCGPVETPIAAVQLRLSFADAPSTTEAYFRCPTCAAAVTTPVGDRASQLLMRAGVAVVGAPLGARSASSRRRDPGD